MKFDIAFSLSLLLSSSLVLPSSTVAAHKPSLVPPSFDCAVRKAAYIFGQQLIPRLGAFEDLFFALGLNTKDCKGEIERPSHPPSVPVNELPHDTVYVAPRGANRPHGSLASPFGSIQSGINAARHTASKLVILRGGMYELSEPLVLDASHSNLSILSFPGESPVISGGQRLRDLTWQPYKVSTSALSARSDTSNIWVTDVGTQVDEVPGLQLNGVRMTRARFPNLPAGIEVSPGYGGYISGNRAKWTPPQFGSFGNVTYYTDTNPARVRKNGGWFERYAIGVGGLCSVYDPAVSYWCSEHPSGGGAFAFRTPSGVTVDDSVLPRLKSYSNVSSAIFFVWRPARWANWMFQVAGYDGKTGNFTFGRGGNQGARGADTGGDWAIENVLEELDAPGEFYFDEASRLLYLFHNASGPPPAEAEFVVPKLRNLLNLTGTQWGPVRNVTVAGLAFRASRYTYMDTHAVPSGGDWALDRNGAIFFQGTERVTVRNCSFERLDGNGVMISGYNRHIEISHSDFAYLGGNAIASWGYTNETSTDPGRPGIVLANAPSAGVDGTDGEHPRHTTVTGCVAREIGLYEKQSSFYVQAKTAEARVVGNVFFNGPRAGINFNDGFGGGDEIARNLVFSTCRESGDHGPLNSWDRQPFLTTVRDGTPSMIMAWRRIHHNFFIDNYSPQEDVDNDDGSAYYKTYDNFLVYGGTGMKSDFGGHDNRHYGNIYAYVRSALAICTQQPGHEDHFVNNSVVMTGTDVGSFACEGSAKTLVSGNSYYTPTGKVTECKMELRNWQAMGNDVGSRVGPLPTDASIIELARKKLGF